MNVHNEVQWNLWIMDTTGPCWSVHNREMSFIQSAPGNVTTLSSCHRPCVWKFSALWVQEALKHRTEMAKIFKNSRYFFNTFTPVSRDCTLSEGNMYWSVISVSTFWSREVSAIWRSQCTINYREWFGTVDSCPRCGGFHNRRICCRRFHCIYL